MNLLLTGLLAGALDGAAATLLFLARGNKNPALLFRYIASAVYGDAAFKGGARMVVLGLLFHMTIAMAWVAFYFAVAGRFPLHPLVYGTLVWVVMNLVVLPLSRAKPRPFSLFFAVVNWLILVVTIGLPSAYLFFH